MGPGKKKVGGHAVRRRRVRPHALPGMAGRGLPGTTPTAILSVVATAAARASERRSEAAWLLPGSRVHYLRDAKLPPIARAAPWD